MDEKNNAAKTAQNTLGDDALFDAIGKKKRKKTIRRWIIVVAIVAALAVGIAAAVRYGRKKVDENFGDLLGGGATSQVMNYVVGSGSVTTTVSGSGQLSDVGSEKLTLPAGVEVIKLLVKAGERVEEGQLLATVDTSSVLTAITNVQSKLSELDVKLNNASFSTAPASISAGVNGRVKALYAQPGDDVAGCMVRNGALAVLSLDGYMAVDVESESLSAGQSVTVRRENGTELPGTVRSAAAGRATVLVTDNGPLLGENVTIRTSDGETLSGTLYIHSPLRITGYAGTVSYSNIKENQQVWLGNPLFVLKDTKISANYDAILRQRHDQEDKLLQLMGLYAAGGMAAPFTGSVSSVEYKDPSTSTGSSSSGSGSGSVGSLGSGATGSGSGSSEAADTALLTLSPDQEMNLTITVDETNILSLRVGQEAQITINSIDDVFFGTVTEINRMASDSESSSGVMDIYGGTYTGVTNYSAVITLPKDPRMLPGMSARALVRIDGAADTILIPSAALHQTSDSFFVYTSCDEATGELGGAVRVVPGLNDGSMTEIIEGLSLGDTVYYMEIFDPYMMYYGYGLASDGNATWVDTGAINASDGDAGMTAEVYAADAAAEENA